MIFFILMQIKLFAPERFCTVPECLFQNLKLFVVLVISFPGLWWTGQKAHWTTAGGKQTPRETKKRTNGWFQETNEAYRRSEKTKGNSSETFIKSLRVLVVWAIASLVSFALTWENSRHSATPPPFSPRNDVWETSAKILYWWRVTTQIHRCIDCLEMAESWRT